MKNVIRKSFIVALTICSLGVFAGETPKVTPNNYVRAETDFQMTGYIKVMDNFGKFLHSRKPYNVHNQVTVRGNRDTLYSFGIFDLSSTLTITLPEPGGRYQSLMVVNQDHYTTSDYGPKTVTLDAKSVGTRYATVLIRTFMDPTIPADVKAAHALQDKVITKQSDIGEFNVPQWDKKEVEEMRQHFNIVGSTVPTADKFFGTKDELDPVYHKLGAAVGWGGLPAKDAIYNNVTPEKNDGKTPYSVTVKDVPVDGFWSITMYDKDGWMPINKYDAYAFNNVTAEKNKDGSITINFGGDPKQKNFLPITDDWNYVVRQYRPRQEILNGTWTFPAPQVK